jgi:nicotinate phosphoribosyltransferase
MVNSQFEISRPVLVGDTADVYLQRTLTILRNEGVNPTVTMEFTPERSGVLCGLTEARVLLSRILPDTGSEVWALEEGEHIEAGEVALRVKAPYGSLGLYETAICGMLAHSTGWATAARECVEAAGETPVVAIGARNVHPNVAANMDYASVKGGCVSCSTIQGARLAGVTPAGNMPHALNLVIGDAVKAIESFDRHMPQEVPRVALVDTFKDEAEEALNVARSLREKLRGIRLDTPPERGGVTQELVKEVRARLDLAGFRHVEIMVTGGFTAARIRHFIENGAPVDTFGVGTYIAAAAPNPFSSDIHEIEGRPIAKRGRAPGVTTNPRLDRVM